MREEEAEHAFTLMRLVTGSEAFSFAIRHPPSGRRDERKPPVTRTKMSFDVDAGRYGGRPSAVLREDHATELMHVIDTARGCRWEQRRRTRGGE